jgi:hypothetical protein
MQVFLSWSGERSKAVAQTFSKWIGQVIQAVDPWISLDIEKGTRWNPEIAVRLEESRVGIICLTKENLDARWILFESGALSKTKDAYLCTLLLDIDPSDVEQPLGQFQHTTRDKNDIRQLLGTINKAVEKEGEKARLPTPFWTMGLKCIGRVSPQYSTTSPRNKRIQAQVKGQNGKCSKRSWRSFELRSAE